MPITCGSSSGSRDVHRLRPLFRYAVFQKYYAGASPVVAEYLDDPDGGGLKGISLRGDPSTRIMSPDANGSIASVAFTLNFKPVPSVKIQPEIRFDTTSYKGGFDGKDNRVVVGIGASYLF